MQNEKKVVSPQSRFAEDVVDYGTRLDAIICLNNTFEEAIPKVFLRREQGRK